MVTLFTLHDLFPSSARMTWLGTSWHNYQEKNRNYYFYFDVLRGTWNILGWWVVVNIHPGTQKVWYLPVRLETCC